MAKFCINCGNPLGEGQLCSCKAPIEGNPVTQQAQPVTQQAQPITQQAQAVTEQPQPATQQAQAVTYQAQPQQQVQSDQPMIQVNGQDFSQYQQQFEKAKQNSTMFLQRVFTTFKSILRSPATEGTKFAVSQNTTIAMGLLAFQGIFTALFALVVTSKINSQFTRAYSQFGRMDYEMANMYKMPLFKIFLLTAIVSVVLSCALAGLLLLAGMVLKNNATYKTMLCVAATRSVAVIPITIISIVIFYFNKGAGISLFYLGNLAGLCYMVSAFPAATSEIKNRIPVIVFIAALIFMFVSLYVMYKCFPSYLPEGLKESWGYIERGLKNPSAIFEEIIGDMY